MATAAASVNFDPTYFVLVTQQQREREAEQYRLTHPQGSAPSGDMAPGDSQGTRAIAAACL